jgi:hypothetical protein
MMDRIRPNLFHFFTKYCKPGIIGIVGTEEKIGMAIREAQGIFKKSMQSFWNRCNPRLVGMALRRTALRKKKPNYRTLTLETSKGLRSRALTEYPGIANGNRYVDIRE